MIRGKLSVQEIGRKIRGLREDREMSMRELAAASEVSVSLISKIESGKVSPTVMSLQKLLEAMDVDLYDFFLDRAAANPSDQIVFRKREMVSAEDEEHKWYYAFPRHPEIKGELTYEEYQSHTKVVEKESHKGDLCGFVISGELTLEVPERGVFVIRSGDAFYVKAGQLHVARNESEKVLKLVAVRFR